MTSLAYNIQTYDGLQAAIADELNRNDLATKIPVFIQLAEATINRVLRVRKMIINLPFSTATALNALPSNFLEATRLRLDSPKIGALQLITNQYADDMNALASIGNPPAYYTFSGDNFELSPPPATTVTGMLTYYSKIPSLTDLTPTNWLLSEAPDLYFYNALLHTAPYLKQDERIAVWTAASNAILNALKEQDEITRFSGNTPKIRYNSFG